MWKVDSSEQRNISKKLIYFWRAWKNEDEVISAERAAKDLGPQKKR